MEVLTAKQSLAMCQKQECALIDVRSENEFSQGHIPLFINIPLLNDNERHLVGLTYKKVGQEAAIKLGYELINPESQLRVERWTEQIQKSPQKMGLIACWRGGLRSKLVVESLLEMGLNAVQVEGGYKAMRRELLETLANPPPLIVLAGMTGSGKTELIHSLPAEKMVDLEGLAEHRGSAFGSYSSLQQPRTATFENRLAIAIREKSGPLIAEDESRSIGRVTIPTEFLQKLRTAPLIILKSPLEQRALHIYKEYIEVPIASGVSPMGLHLEVQKALQSIRKRLGGTQAEEIITMVQSAFDQTNRPCNLHIAWISLLLQVYYDKLYKHSTAYWQRPILFEGDYEACNQWILHHLN